MAEKQAGTIGPEKQVKTEKKGEKKSKHQKKKRVGKLTKPYKHGKKDCPKCGAGVKLAEHKNRNSCGKCGYFEKKS